MIKINLLPKDITEKRPFFTGMDLKGFDIKNVPIPGIIAGVGVILVLTQTALFFFSSSSRGQLAAMTDRYNKMLPEKKEADLLGAKSAGIAKISGIIDGLIAKRFSWAGKINQLSNCVTPGIWLSELYYDERPIAGMAQAVLPGALVISGYASGVGDRGMTLIGKFIESLRNDKDFYSDIASISLVSTKSDKVASQDVMSFKISCQFK